jgi:hypothetical protein
MKLFTFNPFPPGGFPFEQSVNGKIYKWPDVGLDIISQARKIVEFRKANGLPNSDVSAMVSELSEYTCQRLGQDPRFCGDGSQRNTAQVQQSQQGGCRTCGAVLK